MSECTNIDLENARLRQKIPRWKMAGILGVSESTIARWENGEMQPEPDDVDRFAYAVMDQTLWHRWMLSHYDSYRRRYIGADNYSLPIMAMKLRHEMDDVRSLQDALERDSIDGFVDDKQLLEQSVNELKQLIQAGADLLQRLTMQQKESPHEN